MSNEIKVGDTVRVREDAPKIYIKAIFPNLVSSNMEVTEIEDECARIKPLISKGAYLTFEFIIPLKYLIKVEEERKEAKFKVGDWVMISGVFNPQLNGMIGWVSRINEDGYKVSFQDGRFAIVEDKYLTLITQPTVQTEAEKKPCEGISEETANEISDMLEAYVKALSGIADSFDWQRYETELAKEIALKVANKYTDPEETAYYAVKVAKAVAEGLKRK